LSNLVRNGDLPVGDARFYAVFGSGNNATVADGQGRVAVFNGATDYYHGVMQQQYLSQTREAWHLANTLLQLPFANAF
jgi:hypothetical protein